TFYRAVDMNLYRIAKRWAAMGRKAPGTGYAPGASVYPICLFRYPFRSQPSRRFGVGRGLLLRRGQELRPLLRGDWDRLLFRQRLLRRRRGRLDGFLRHGDRRGLGGLIRCGVLRRLGDGGLLGGWRAALRFLGGHLLRCLGLGRELEGRIGAAVGDRESVV